MVVSKYVSALTYSGMELQDFAGAADVFVKAIRFDSTYQINTISLNEKYVSTELSLVNLKPRISDFTLLKNINIDILIIPGAPMAVINNLTENINFIFKLKQIIAKAKTVLSVCTGAFLLAATNLLDERNATTHYQVVDEFAKRFPRVKVQKDVRFVQSSDKLTTASGVTSGIDAALFILKEYSSEEVFKKVSNLMQYSYRQFEAWPR